MLSGCSPACRRRSRCRGGVPVRTNNLSDYRGTTAPSLRLMARSRRQGHQRGDVDCPRVAVAPIRLMPEVGDVSRCPPTVMMVTSIVATSFSCPWLTAKTSPVHTVTVRPGFVTRPRATSSSPCPGERKFTLYSMVSTSELGSVRVIRSEEHTSELQSPCNLVCRLL